MEAGRQYGYTEVDFDNVDHDGNGAPCILRAFGN